MRLRQKWVVFVTAPDQITGEMWCSMLRASGVNCRLRDSNPSFIGPSLYPVRLMAPEGESELALEMLQSDVELGPLNAIHSPEDPRGEHPEERREPKHTLGDEPAS